MSYYVYFDSIKGPYCGWLTNDDDLTVCDHLANHAIEFKTKEEALHAANERLIKLHAMFDKLASTYETYDANEAKKNCKFWILEKVEDRGNV